MKPCRSFFIVCERACASNLLLLLAKKSVGVIQPRRCTAAIFLRERTCPVWNMVWRWFFAFAISMSKQSTRQLKVAQTRSAYDRNEVIKMYEQQYTLYAEQLRKRKWKETWAKLIERGSTLGFHSLSLWRFDVDTIWTKMKQYKFYWS